MNLSQFLDNLKLTVYEKEVIIYLSSVDSADAKTVYRNAKVPQGRIYSVLQDLVSMGFVNIIPASPKRYRIKDIRKALQHHLRTKKALLDEKIGEVPHLEIGPKIFNIEKKDPSVHILTGRDEHIDAIINFRDDAKKELLQIAPLFQGTYASHLSLKKALQKGVVVKIIVSAITEKNMKNIKECLAEGGEVRQSNSKDLLSLLIKDSSEFLLGVQDYRFSEERMTLYGRNQDLLISLKDTFDRLWAQSKPVKPR